MILKHLIKVISEWYLLTSDFLYAIHPPIRSKFYTWYWFFSNNNFLCSRAHFSLKGLLIPCLQVWHISGIILENWLHFPSLPALAPLLFPVLCNFSFTWVNFAIKAVSKACRIFALVLVGLSWFSSPVWLVDLVEWYLLYGSLVNVQ